VLAAAALTPADGRIRFVLLGDGNRRADLQAAVLAAGLSNVTFLPPEPDATYPGVLAAADVLLVTERATVMDMALPSKLTSYAVAGRPVIAAVNPDGATAAEVERAGNGLVIRAEDPLALLEAIERLRFDQALVDRLAAAGPVHARVALSSAAALARATAFVDAIAGATAPTLQRVSLEVPA
jgi:colanic acid biosynthesis glycosyl transferase WcaI